MLLRNLGLARPPFYRQRGRAPPLVSLLFLRPQTRTRATLINLLRNRRQLLALLLFGNQRNDHFREDVTLPPPTGPTSTPTHPRLNCFGGGGLNSNNIERGKSSRRTETNNIQREHLGRRRCASAPKLTTHLDDKYPTNECCCLDFFLFNFKTHSVCQSDSCNLESNL